MVFLGHLVIAVVFIIGLYLAVTYTNLNLEIEDIKNLRHKIQGLLQHRYQVLRDLSVTLKNSQLYEKLHRDIVESLSVSAESTDFSEQVRCEPQLFRLADACLQAFKSAEQLQANAEVKTLLQMLDSYQRQLAYVKAKYNAAVALYLHHKRSPYARVVLKLWKRLDQVVITLPV